MTSLHSTNLPSEPRVVKYLDGGVRRFGLLEALNGPRNRQTTTKCEKRVLRKGSGLRGVHVVKEKQTIYELFPHSTSPTGAL